MRLTALAIAALLVAGALIGFLTRSTGAKAATTTTTTLRPGGLVATSLANRVGLVNLHGAAAPAFSLATSTGGIVSTASLRGSPVLLAFLDPNCSGICPIVATELRAATADLGTRGRDLTVVVVNVDSSHASAADAAALQRALQAGQVAKVVVATGSASALRPVWRAYGVQVEVDQTSGALLYTTPIVFIDAGGRELYRATPYGNEHANGRFSLTTLEMRQFGAGLAHFAAPLLASTS
jgi:cytochrome oxidase Cu insertion factor (SCO1/SenC/PrrC family)